MELLIVCLFVGFVGALYFLFLITRAESKIQKRRRAHEDWLIENPEWVHSTEGNSDLYQRYKFLKSLRNKDDGILDVFEGEWRNYISKAFTFYWTNTRYSSSGWVTDQFFSSVVLIHGRHKFSRLSIQPAGLLHKIGLHHNPVVLPSKEFDRKFVVWTSNKQFALHFCHKAMMEYFLRFPNLHLEIDRDVLVIYLNDRLEVDNIKPCLEHLDQIYQMGSRAVSLSLGNR